MMRRRVLLTRSHTISATMELVASWRGNTTGKAARRPCLAAFRLAPLNSGWNLSRVHLRMIPALGKAGSTLWKDFSGVQSSRNYPMKPQQFIVAPTVLQSASCTYSLAATRLPMNRGRYALNRRFYPTCGYGCEHSTIWPVQRTGIERRTGPQLYRAEAGIT